VTQKLKVRIDGEFVAATPGPRASSRWRGPRASTSPRLCYMDGLTAVGACRLCMVEVQGVSRLLPARARRRPRTAWRSTTTSPQLQSYRKIALELLFAERNHVCAGLRVERALRAAGPRPGARGHARALPLQLPPACARRHPSHPRFVLDHNRCVLCSRCVRACGEIEGAHVWDIGRTRGHPSRGW